MFDALTMFGGIILAICKADCLSSLIIPVVFSFQIMFYKDHNFKAKSHDSKGDSADLYGYICWRNLVKI